MGEERDNTTPEGNGGPGEFQLDPLHPRRDMAMMARFPIRADVRGPAANMISAIVLNKEVSIRNRLAAARVLQSFDKLNMDQEAINAGRAPVDQQTGDSAQAISAMRRELWQDEHFADYLRDRSGKEDADPGSVGGDGDAELEDGAASGHD